MYKKLLFLICLLASGIINFAQQTFPVNGPVRKSGTIYAFTHATIHVDFATTLTDATLIIEDNKIIAAATSLVIPANAVVVDLKQKHIYPSFIDLYTGYGIETAKRSDNSFSPQLESKKEGPYNWNQSIQPEITGAALFSANQKEAAEFRKIGFGSVLSHYTDGIMRGTGCLVTLGTERDVNLVLKAKASNHLSFSKGSSRQTYPSSLMGSIALIKQTYLDASWYKNPVNRDHTNLSLQAVNDNSSLPQIFEAADKFNILRASNIAKENGLNYIYLGGGDEYQRIPELKAINPKLIIPVTFPEAYDVTDPYDAQFVTLEDLKNWELAPANAGLLEKNGFDFTFTANGLKDKKDFLKNIRKAIKYGLSEQAALKALTHNPANFVQANNQVGALRKGYEANFFISNDNIFAEKSRILENWVQGHAFVLDELPEQKIDGKYTLNLGEKTFSLITKNENNKVKAHVLTYETKDGKIDTVKTEVKIEQNRSLITVSFQSKDPEFEGLVRLSGTINNNNWSGNAKLASGKWIPFTATPISSLDTAKAEKPEEKDSPELGLVTYPNMAYGRVALPTAKTILFKNATVWTNEKDGISQNTDVMISNGKITNIGKGISAGNAEVVDATGKHLTSGIIDEHSHIAISRGVNEGGQAISAEVTIEDVVNSDDVNVYRQLAGGVTAAQLLHGSANPIGGRSALIKLKYGYAPEDMKIPGADKFIKFALGENVKQSNWGDFNTIRFPQTRMGVEQIMKDAFLRAREYEASWKNASSKGPSPRRDIEMETLLEILNSKRFITCHSYVQSEINMLMKLAEELGFRVNTFTHILEGYKVADKMAKHGAAGSTFGDWWAYKYEVRDAIPYNAALMHSQGVNVAINSDDAEMARRLNQEAAKSIKYGGLTEEEAWKLVTLNPAKMLHLDKKMGSIAVGKDADLVLWSDNPLSIYAKPIKTLIDGAVFYDVNEDAQLRQEMNIERERIIQAMLEAKKKGEPTKKVTPKKQHLYHCDDLEQ